MTTLLDLSKVPPPDAVTPIVYEAIRAAYLADLLPRLHARGIPVVAEESRAYREMLVLQAKNEAVKAVMLATALRGDLDSLSSDFGVVRRVLVPATDDTPAVMEGDAELRYRRQLAPHALAAGTAAAYEFAALQATTEVRQARARGGHRRRPGARR